MNDMPEHFTSENGYSSESIPSFSITNYTSGIQREKFQWCDICDTVGIVNGTGHEILLNPRPRRPVWLLMICDEHAAMIGLKEYHIRIECPAYVFPDDTENPKCKIQQELGFDFKLNCEACVVTRLRSQLGMPNDGWFDTWGQKQHTGTLWKRMLAALKLGILMGEAGLAFQDEDQK